MSSDDLMGFLNNLIAVRSLSDEKLFSASAWHVFGVGPCTK